MVSEKPLDEERFFYLISNNEDGTVDVYLNPITHRKPQKNVFLILDFQ